MAKRDTSVQNRDYRIRYPWRHILMNAKGRAARRGLECDLDIEWATSRWTGRCELTGLEFRMGTTHGPTPYSVSIDRIDASKGYVKGNCRFILFALNALKGTGTDADARVIAEAFVGV